MNATEIVKNILEGDLDDFSPADYVKSAHNRESAVEIYNGPLVRVIQPLTVFTVNNYLPDNAAWDDSYYQSIEKGGPIYLAVDKADHDNIAIFQPSSGNAWNGEGKQVDFKELAYLISTPGPASKYGEAKNPQEDKNWLDLQQGLATFFMAQIAKKKNVGQWVKFLTMIGRTDLATNYARYLGRAKLPFGKSIDAVMAMKKAGKRSRNRIARLMKSQENVKWGEHGFWLLFDDWSDLAPFYGASRNYDFAKNAEKIFSGDTTEWFDNAETKPEEVWDSLSDSNLSVIKQLLINRTVYNSDGEEHLVTQENVEELTDDEIKDIVCDRGNKSDSCDDIYDAIRWGANDAYVSSSEGAYYDGYRNALMKEWGLQEDKTIKWINVGKREPDKKIEGGGVQRGHQKQMLGLYFPYSTLEEWIAKWKEDEYEDDYYGDIHDLAKAYLEKVTPNEDYSGDFDDAYFNEQAAHHLSELEATAPEKVSDANQPELPLEGEPAPQAREIERPMSVSIGTNVGDQKVHKSIPPQDAKKYHSAMGGKVGDKDIYLQAEALLAIPLNRVEEADIDPKTFAQRVPLFYVLEWEWEPGQFMYFGRYPSDDYAHGCGTVDDPLTVKFDSADEAQKFLSEAQWGALEWGADKPYRVTGVYADGTRLHESHRDVTISFEASDEAAESLVPLLKELKKMGSQGSSRDIKIQDWDGKSSFGFDGDGASKIGTIKVDGLVVEAKGSESVKSCAVRRGTTDEALEVPQAQVDAILAEMRKIAAGSSSVSDFTARVEERFKEYKITFSPRADFPPGIPGAATEDGIYLRPPGSLDGINGWLSGISRILHHELIHMLQIERSGPNAAEMCASGMRSSCRNGQMDLDGYRRQKQEIMAFAGTLVNDWRQAGLSPAEMRSRLQARRWSTSVGHERLRLDDPKRYNLFLRYAVEYIGGREPVAEGVDPKAFLARLPHEGFLLVYKPTHPQGQTLYYAGRNDVLEKGVRDWTAWTPDLDKAVLFDDEAKAQQRLEVYELPHSEDGGYFISRVSKPTHQGMRESADPESLLQEAVYKLSTTQIDLPKEIGGHIIQWGELNIADEDLYIDEKDGCGRETEQHVTVLYGLTEPSPSETLTKIVESTKPFLIEFAGISIFENEKYDVIKLDVISEELHNLHLQIRKACPNENKFPDYIPHCTVAYVQKGKGKKYAGQDVFKAATVARDFWAYDLLFKGAGDSEDGERVVQLIHFDKSKPIEAVQESENTGQPEPVSQQDGLPVYSGKAAYRWLFNHYGIPNSINTPGETTPFGRKNAMFVDDSQDGKPVAIWVQESVTESDEVDPKKFTANQRIDPHPDWRLVDRKQDQHGRVATAYEHKNGRCSFKLINDFFEHNTPTALNLWSVYVYDNRGEFLDGEDFQAEEFTEAETTATNIAFTLIHSTAPSLFDPIQEAEEIDPKKTAMKVALNRYRFTIDDGAGNRFSVDLDGLDQESAFDEAVESGELSQADRDYVSGIECIVGNIGLEEPPVQESDDVDPKAMNVLGQEQTINAKEFLSRATKYRIRRGVGAQTRYIWQDPGTRQMTWKDYDEATLFTPDEAEVIMSQIGSEYGGQPVTSELVESDEVDPKSFVTGHEVIIREGDQYLYEVPQGGSFTWTRLAQEATRFDPHRAEEIIGSMFPHRQHSGRPVQVEKVTESDEVDPKSFSARIKPFKTWVFKVRPVEGGRMFQVFYLGQPVGEMHMGRRGVPYIHNYRDFLVNRIAEKEKISPFYPARFETVWDWLDAVNESDEVDPKSFITKIHHHELQHWDEAGPEGGYQCSCGKWRYQLTGWSSSIPSAMREFRAHKRVETAKAKNVKMGESDEVDPKVFALRTPTDYVIKRYTDSVDASQVAYWSGAGMVFYRDINDAHIMSETEANAVYKRMIHANYSPNELQVVCVKRGTVRGKLNFTEALNGPFDDEGLPGEVTAFLRKVRSKRSRAKTRKPAII